MWRNEWLAISGRILALFQSVQFLAQADRDTHSLSDEIYRNANGLKELISKFSTNYSAQLGDQSQECIAQFLTGYAGRFAQPLNGELFTALSAVTMLASFRAEFEYYVKDSEAVGRSLVARAFEHLQRSIVADEDVRNRWGSAFKKSELECERLGACHLLLHGVWAFKANGAGERTDLVMGTRLDITESVRRAADTLVLTEWKLVSKASDGAAEAEQALKQAIRYTEGILAGFELSSRRYLILVSDKRLINFMPAVIRNGTTYECINVAVDPDPPSKR